MVHKKRNISAKDLLIVADFVNYAQKKRGVTKEQYVRLMQKAGFSNGRIIEEIGRVW